jgi:hypothetical protein
MESLTGADIRKEADTGQVDSIAVREMAPRRAKPGTKPVSGGYRSIPLPTTM